MIYAYDMHKQLHADACIGLIQQSPGPDSEDPKLSVCRYRVWVVLGPQHAAPMGWASGKTEPMQRQAVAGGYKQQKAQHSENDY